MNGGFVGKTALVTGASRGIGREIARTLAAAGATVIVAARSLEDASRVAGEIEQSGGRGRAVSLDISDDASVASAAKEVLEVYGSIPLLVNNAGITKDNLLMRMKREEWDLVVGTNLTGVFRMCRAFVPAMVKTRYGRIVNVTSVVGKMGNAGQANYGATKAGIEGFTRSLAREIASRNVTVNCVAPGFIDTDMTRAIAEDARTQLTDQIPLKRLGSPADVAGAVRFLLSDDAAYITGATLDVNGGMYM